MSIFIGGVELKKAYLGSGVTNITCDFTTSDNWFTYAASIGSPSYSRNSTYWLYGYRNSNTNLAVAWKIPSSVYSQWELQKAVLTARSSHTRSGVGLSLGVDTTIARLYDKTLTCSFWSSTSTTLTNYVAANTNYTITIDLQNKQLYVSTETSKVLTLSDTQISSIKSSRQGGTMNICALGYRSSWTCYFGIRDATFTVII